MTIRPEENYISGLDIINDDLAIESEESDRLGKRNKEEIFAYYWELKESREIFDGFIIGSNKKNELLVQIKGDCDIEGIIAVKEIKGYRKDISISPLYYVGKNFPVIVTAVDSRNNTIHFSINKAKESLRMYIWDTIKESLESNEPLEVVAKVLLYDLNRRCINVDIYGQGVKGVIHNIDWDQKFVEDIVSDVNSYVDQFIKVSVVGIEESTQMIENDGKKYPKKIKKAVCSRVSILDEYKKNPWDGIEKRYSRRDLLIVTFDRWLVENDKFFGNVMGLHGIQVLCYDPQLETIPIVEGRSYKAVVHKIKEKERIFTVKILGIVDI